MENFNDIFQDTQCSISAGKCLSPKLIKHLNYKTHKKQRREKRKEEIQRQNEKKVNLSTVEVKNNVYQDLKYRCPTHLRASIKQKQQINFNGNKIYSRLEDGNFDRKAQIFYNNGALFKGKYKNGMMIQGKFQFSNGFSYQGGFMADKFFGQGILRFPDGKKISGDWNQQRIIGNGQIAYQKGDIYYGQIQNFRKHGFGYLFLTDGSKYVGQFKEGKIHGKGSYFKDQILVAEGHWQNGQLIKVLPLQNYEFHNIQCKGVKQKSVKFNLNNAYDIQNTQSTGNMNLLDQKNIHSKYNRGKKQKQTSIKVREDDEHNELTQYFEYSVCDSLNTANEQKQQDE